MLSRSSHSPRPRRSPLGARRSSVGFAALLAAGGLLAGAASPVSAAPQQRPTQRPGNVQQVLDRLVSDGKVPAALASVRSVDGRTRHYVAGVAELGTKRKPPVNGQVRIGSNTKTFVAVAVLQLVGDGKIDLDASVETYLPGLVRGQDIDGKAITVRQLLQHTSGLPDYVNVLMAGGDLFAIQHTYFQPRALLDMALTGKASFAPGTKWEYSNTNTLLAGLIIEKVTGRPLAEVLTERVIRRAGLRNTYFPAVGEQDIRGPHPHGYYANKPGEPLRDITSLDPSWGWAAGQMVSTNSDLNTFFTALLAGKLLQPEQLRQMKTTVPTDDANPDRRHGLGIFSRELSCGGVYWGHGGDIPGYSTRGGVTDNGRAAHLAVTSIPSTKKAADDAYSFIDTALCT